MKLRLPEVGERVLLRNNYNLRVIGTDIFLHFGKGRVGTVLEYMPDFYEALVEFDNAPLIPCSLYGGLKDTPDSYARATPAKVWVDIDFFEDMNGEGYYQK